MSVKQLELGVAVIGLGVGEQHARAYLSTGHCQIRWLYDFDLPKAKRLTEELGTGSAALDFESILRDPCVQVVSIASNDDDHFKQVIPALKAGKHLFVEKPLCRSLEELRTVKECWEKNGSRQLTSNLVLRAAPLYRWLKRKIEEGELGEIYAFDGDYLYGRLHKITEGWRKEVEDYSVIQGGGIHLVDLMLWLTSHRPVSVSAVGNRICTKGTPFRYNDYLSATFQFPSGLVGRITANFGGVHRHQHVVRIFGTKGTFIYDDQGPRLHTSRDPSVAPTALELPGLPASKGDLIPEFIELVLSGTDTRAETQHEFDVISSCVAVDRALAASTAAEVKYV